MKHEAVNIGSLRAWCKAVETHLEKNQIQKVQALVKLLEAKTKKMEDKEVASRRKAWRKAFTTPTAQRAPSGMGRPLSRLAYRWVKGIAGWK